MLVGVILSKHVAKKSSTKNLHNKNRMFRPHRPSSATNRSDFLLKVSCYMFAQDYSDQQILHTLMHT